MQVGLPGILFVVFLVLKLIGIITWSWWWVTAPLWIGFALVMALWAVGLAIATLGVALSARSRIRR